MKKRLAVLCLGILFVSGSSLGATFYVDDNYVNDPGPQDPNLSDPLENGSSLHPYDRIQEAINRAVSGSTVSVSPGTYYENINFMGKNIVVTSEPNCATNTIIDGGQKGSVVTFSGSETPNCVLRGFTITNGNTVNPALSGGGGIWGYFTDATIESCRILRNESLSSGGGIAYCDGSIRNCIIMSNTARAHGGGLVYCDGRIVNCVIAGNTADYGGALYGCDGQLVNCTIAGNSAATKGGGLHYCNSLKTNCIFWGNSAPIGANINYSGTPKYSCIEDWSGQGTGNISADPMFTDFEVNTDPATWDLHLLPLSPCIDTGANSAYTPIPSSDIEGTPRPVAGDPDGVARVDMGAYEFNKIISEPYLVLKNKYLQCSAFEAGSDPVSQTVMIINAGRQRLDWSLDASTFPDWLTMSPTSGSLEFGQHEQLTVSIDVNDLAAGHYSCIIDPAASSRQKMTVDLDVIGPALSLSSDTFEFKAADFGVDPDSQTLTITNSGGGLFNWSINTSGIPDWLALVPTVGSLKQGESEIVQISVKTEGLEKTFYTCALSVVEVASGSILSKLDVSLLVGDMYVPLDFQNIQEAIDAARNGDKIIVMPGTYYENISFKNKNITLVSTDPQNADVVARTIINGGQQGSVVTFGGNEAPTCVLSGLTICNGRSKDYGGGITGNRTDASIQRCTIRDNFTPWSGGALANCDGIIDNCIISHNNGAGVFFCWGPISNCVIENNTGTYGGGCYSCLGSITDCLIRWNTTTESGGGLLSCSGNVANCTIVGNTASKNGGGASDCRTIHSCIFWGNSAGIGNQLSVGSRPDFSCIQDWTGAGTGNFKSDPMFVDEAAGNFRLLRQSPCVDAGRPNSVDPQDTDLDGCPRVNGPAVDMGAYEYRNKLPKADANDIRVYAWVDGYAQVTLDGSGSYDEDGDPLTFAWYNDANEFIAAGPEPNVIFEAGEHVLTLVANDGADNSEPDFCTITVVAPEVTAAKMLPQVVNLKSSRTKILGRLQFTRREMPVLDQDQPMLLLIEDKQIEAQQQLLVYVPEEEVWYLTAQFDTAAFEATIGTVTIRLVARYADGPWVYGIDQVRFLDTIHGKSGRPGDHGGGLDEMN